MEPTELAGYPGLVARPASNSAKPWVLWLHGITNTPAYCAPWLAALAAAGYPAIALARRGRMRLPPARARGVTFADYLQDSLTVFDGLTPAPVLLGHSQGGLLALKVAEMRSPRALVLLAPLPPRGILPSVPTLATLPANTASLGRILGGGTFAPTLRQAQAMFLNGVPPDQRARLYADGVPDSARSLRPAYLPGVSVAPERVTGPLLCISGGRDRTISTRAVGRLARRYGGEHLDFPELAHEFIHEPKGHLVAAAISGWLDRTV